MIPAGGGGGQSYSETSSATASLTQGMKSSGLTIAAPLTTPSFLSEAISGRLGNSSAGASSTLLTVSVLALVVALVLIRKGAK